MKIRDLEFFLIDSSAGNKASGLSRSLVVRMETDNGSEGWGESPVSWRVDELSARREFYLPILAGRNVHDVHELLRLDVLNDARLAFAIETAAWDLVARGARQPLCNLWGGAYRSHVGLTAQLRANSANEAAEQAQEFENLGYHTLMISADDYGDQFCNAVLEITEATQGRVRLRIDGCELWPLKQAVEIFQRLEHCPIAWVLDPIVGGDLSQTAMLRRQTIVELALCRPLTTAQQVLAISRSAAAQHLVLDIAQLGGLTAAKQSIAIADAAGISTSVMQFGSCGISATAILHLLASSPCLLTQHDLEFFQQQNSLLCEDFEVIDAMVAIPQGDGIGVRIDRAKLERMIAVS